MAQSVFYARDDTAYATIEDKLSEIRASCPPGYGCTVRDWIPKIEPKIREIAGTWVNQTPPDVISPSSDLLLLSLQFGSRTSSLWDVALQRLKYGGHCPYRITQLTDTPQRRITVECCHHGTISRIDTILPDTATSYL